MKDKNNRMRINNYSFVYGSPSYIASLDPKYEEKRGRELQTLKNEDDHIIKKSHNSGVCPKCGAKVQQLDLFCFNCSAKLRKGH